LSHGVFCLSPGESTITAVSVARLDIIQPLKRVGVGLDRPGNVS